MPRATKIVATLGPVSSDPAVLERLLRAGVDVVRLNFSHGTAQDPIDRAKLVRETALRVGNPVALMADLQGPGDRKFKRRSNLRAPTLDRRRRFVPFGERKASSFGAREQARNAVEFFTATKTAYAAG